MRRVSILLLGGFTAVAACAHPAPTQPTTPAPETNASLVAALSHDPNNRDVNWQLGRMAEGQGDLMRAEQYYERAEALGQPEHEVVPAILRVLVAAQRYDEALARCKKQLSDNPLDRPTRFVAAALLQAADRPKEAERELNQLVRMQPADPAPYVALARLYRDGYSDAARARALFEKSLPLIKDQAELQRLRYEIDELPVPVPSPLDDSLAAAAPVPAGATQMIPDAVFEQTLLGFLAPVAHFLKDDTGSEIMINGTDDIYVERRGRLERTEARFASEHALASAVRNIAQYVGKSVDPERPILDARLPDGSRVCAILPPAARAGICVSIRRFPKERLTVAELVKVGALTESARRFLELCVLVKRNIMVAGGTGSGKTSMLNALSSFMPAHERIVVIEDSSEVRLQQPHAVYLEARPPDPRGRGAVPIRELLRATLRMRPDRIVVGECRGGEALDLIQAMTSGHGGSLSTVHATYPHDTLNRLETLCLMSDVELPLAALRAQVASAVNIVVQTARMNDGTRKVTHVAECTGLDEGGRYALHMLFEFRHAGTDTKGRVLGQLTATRQRPSFAAEVEEQGWKLPAEMM